MAIGKIIVTIKVKWWAKPILFLSVKYFDYVPKFCFSVSTPWPKKRKVWIEFFQGVIVGLLGILAALVLGAEQWQL